VIRTLSDKGFACFEFLWRKFGPKEVKERNKDLFEMKDEYLETTEDPRL
jgi:hypothetical protein